MKVCFVGAGSIGKRHIRNFHHLCRQDGLVPEIHLLRSTAAPLPPDVAGLVARQFYRREDLDGFYDAVFITNPTHLHFQTLRDMAGTTRHFFIEKPLFETADRDVVALGLADAAVCQIACPIRFTEVVEQARKRLPDLAVYSARAICSSYLPDWRPGADYRQVYSAKKELGGGVCLDLIHEWDYLTSLFGFPEEVRGFSGRVSRLEIDSEDLAVYIARYPDKMLELHLDYFGRLPRRELELFTPEATWLFDILHNRIHRNGEPVWSGEEDANAKYLKEMRCFLDLCLGRRESPNDMQNAIRVMALAERARPTSL